MNPTWKNQNNNLDGAHDNVAAGPSMATPDVSPTLDRRRGRKRLHVAAATLALAAILPATIGNDPVAAYDNVQGCDADGPHDPSAPGAGDGALWDRIRSIGLPDQWWEPVAIAMGLSPRGSWISADGLIWEHLDGRRVEVAAPRASATPNAGGQACS